uniref:Serpentine receptor class gamma n=1 Tax=Heterorhabditis bacteriophora TaxID=37862 RepID=A0A1I7XEV9_HETBA
MVEEDIRIPNNENERLRSHVIVGLYIICMIIAVLVRENIKTSRLINRMFITFTILFVTALLFYIAYEAVNVNGIYLFLGFIFDAITAFPTTLIPLLIITGDEKLKHRIRQLISRATSNKISYEPRIHPVTDIEGNIVNIEILYAIIVTVCSKYVGCLPCLSTRRKHILISSIRPGSEVGNIMDIRLNPYARFMGK